MSFRLQIGIETWINLMLNCSEVRIIIKNMHTVGGSAGKVEGIKQLIH